MVGVELHPAIRGDGAFVGDVFHLREKVVEGGEVCRQRRLSNTDDEEEKGEAPAHGERLLCVDVRSRKFVYIFVTANLPIACV